MKRLFAAIKIIPDENFLKTYYRMLKTFEGERIKWVEPNNLHITLKFFGETHKDNIDSICDVISKVSSAHKPFRFNLKDIGIFGSFYKPRVIWFGIEKDETLKAIGVDLQKSLETIGFLNDRQNFVPHLTVARIRKLEHKRFFQEKINQFKGVFIQEIIVNQVYLFESTLTVSDPIYNVVERFRLH